MVEASVSVVLDQLTVPLNAVDVPLTSVPAPESKLKMYCDNPDVSVHFVAKTDGVPALTDVTARLENFGGPVVAAPTLLVSWTVTSATEYKNSNIIRLTPKKRVPKPGS
jgi:hypothetical protein